MILYKPGDWVAFEPTELEELIGEELILTIVDLSEHGIKRNSQYLGTIEEVIKFDSESNLRESYLLGELEKITDLEGITLPATSKVDHYMFKLESVEFPENLPPVLTGELVSHSVIPHPPGNYFTPKETGGHSPYLVPFPIPIGKTVKVYFKEIPTKKRRQEITWS